MPTPTLDPAVRGTRPSRPTYAGIFLVSAATLLLQVTFTRIFSVSIWYHFAFLVVSVALFGFGASGVALSLVPRSTADSRLQFGAPVLFALTAALSYLGTRVVPFSPFEILQSKVQVIYFFVYDVLLMLPFFFSGATVGLLLRQNPGHASSLYAFDLVGAALGSLLLFGALPPLGGAGTVFLAAFLGCAAAACLAPTRVTRIAALALAVLFVALLVRPERLPDVRVDRSKALAAEMRRGGRLVFTAWNALSRIDVVEHVGAGPVILIDAAAATPIAKPQHYDGTSLPDISGVALLLLSNPSVVIIGSGGGGDVQQAIGLGARDVTAVEINPIIIDLVTHRYRDRVGGVFSNPKVRLVRDEGRSFIERRRESADLIQITLIDTWAAGASGAYSLTENYLYTVEAFRSYIEHLSPEGLLSITRWHHEMPRLVALGRSALESAGVTEPSRHILVLRQDIRMLLLLKRTPFTAEDVQVVRSYALENNSTVVHDPTAPDTRSFYGAFLTSPDPARIVRATPTAIDPVHDDDPFFFQMGRWSRLDLDSLRRFTGKTFLEPLTAPVGQIALLTALGLGLLLSVVLLWIPIGARAVPRPRRMTWLAYFAGLGLAYIIIEVVLMQRFALFLGHPTYSVTTVLCAILLFSGAGSAWSGTRKGDTARLVRPLLWLLPTAIVCLTFFVPLLTRELIGLPHAVRVMLALCFIAPLAFLMGMPFPIGIRAVGATEPAHVGWAWAANGCASVVGSVTAVLGAMLWNFSTMLVAAGVIYVLALTLIARLRIPVD